MNNTVKEEFLKLRRSLIERDFSRMNDKQKEAVFYMDGPLIIFAGAGSGKTTVIVNRVANMIKYGYAYNSDLVPSYVTEETIDKLKNFMRDGGNSDDISEIIKVSPVAPCNILTITFTNKAANELKERLSLMLGENSKDVWASTFHSMCCRILRIHADKLGYTNQFAIYDTDDTKKLIKDCQKQLKIDDKVLSYKSIASEISRAKDQLLGVRDFKVKYGSDYRLSKIAEVYELYQKRLKDAGAMDFDDLIVNTINLFKSFPDVLEKYQEKFKYIFVDEYQDTNYAQYILVKLLSDKYGNLCVVGDDDQSIYKFRGATVENIINFEKIYPQAKTIRLEQNYRSTKNILNAANALIANNENRKGKTLWTENPVGEKISVHTAYSEYDEANYIVNAIKKGVDEGRKYTDFAVLYRMNSQSNVLEKVFVKSGIPYRMLGGVRFYERKEIKDMIAYLSVINNPLDEVRLRRIINQPRRSIGERTISQALEIAVQTNTGLLDVIRNADKYDSLQRVSVKLQAFAEIIDSLKELADSGRVSLEELYNMVLDKMGYIEFLKNDDDDAESRIENIHELSSNIIKYESEHPEGATLSGFLEEVSLMTDIDNYDENSDSVVLMTMHSAKGLEFPVVFLPGVEEGIFPGMQATYDPIEVQEERRLAYVGITRAKEKLYMLNSDSRMIFGSTSHNKLSRFVSEVPEDIILRTKSRDWKKLDPSEETPKSAQEMRVKSAIAARHFGQVVGGVGKSANLSFNPGDFVLHNTFGKGTVLSSMNMGNDSMLEINFENIGIKKLMSNFARLQKV